MVHLSNFNENEHIFVLISSKTKIMRKSFSQNFRLRGGSYRQEFRVDGFKNKATCNLGWCFLGSFLIGVGAWPIELCVPFWNFCTTCWILLRVCGWIGGGDEVSSFWGILGAICASLLLICWILLTIWGSIGEITVLILAWGTLTWDCCWNGGVFLKIILKLSNWNSSFEFKRKRNSQHLLNSHCL